MKTKKRENALASLASDMDVETLKCNDVNKELREDVNEKPKTTPKAKSRVVSNVPWYPKSDRLKKELKMLALHEDTSLTALIDEGISMVLEKRGKDINDYL